LIEASRRR